MSLCGASPKLDRQLKVWLVLFRKNSTTEKAALRPSRVQGRRGTKNTKKGRRMIRQEQEATAKKVLDCAYEVHSRLGPGLLESAYQACLLHELHQQGIFVECEKPLPLLYKGITIDCGYRVDMLIEHDRLIIENKAVKELNDTHLAQILTYMRLTGVSLGFLFNFNTKRLKDGERRVVL
jgi:GxxExxY protein